MPLAGSGNILVEYRSDVTSQNGEDGILARIFNILHIDKGVGDAIAIEEAPGARSIFAPVGAIDVDVGPDTIFLPDGWGLNLYRSIAITHEKMANAVAHLSDIRLMTMTGTDESPILHGIAGPLLSRAEWPTERMSLPFYACRDSLPDIRVRVQLVGAYLRIAYEHAPSPIRKIPQALTRTGCACHIGLHLTYLRGPVSG